MGDTVTINGQVHDWESVTVTGPQGVFTGISEINWKASQKKKRVYGRGAVPVGATRGQYEGSVDLTLLTTEYDALAGSLSGGIFKSAFNVAVAMETDGLKTRETVLRSILIDDVDESAKQGDEELTVKLSGTVEMIERNGTPDYQ